jgi:hypothetical protein
MKGRVVRKAKRRLPEDERKNVFAGFTGLSAPTISAEQAFRYGVRRSQAGVRRRQVRVRRRQVGMRRRQVGMRRRQVGMRRRQVGGCGVDMLECGVGKFGGAA